MPRNINEPLRIVIDTREQTPWSWEPSDAITTVAGLNAGDYALLADTEPVRGKDRLAVRFAIERKSLEDFLGTISTG
jgi:ERCC4-type nuclease